MRNVALRSSRSLIAVSLGLLSALISTATAATLGVPKVSPMPFRAGEPVTVTAAYGGPYINGTAYISVSDGAKVIFQNSESFGAVANGTSGTRAWTFTVPVSPQVKSLQIFVVFLEGDEKWVGEPGSKSMNLQGRCSRRADRREVIVPCTYATAKHWAMVTPAK